MSTHLRDYQHGDYELSTYQNRDKSLGSISIDIKTPDGTVIGAFGELDTEAQALQIGKAFCGGYSEGVSRAPAPRLHAPQNFVVVRLRDVLAEAGSLVSEDEGNPEYDRALVELVGRLVGIDLNGDARTAVDAIIRGY